MVIHDAASSQGKNSTWRAIITSPRNDIEESERLPITARASDAYRNDSIARAAIDRPCIHTLGVGLHVNVNLNAKQLGISREEAIERSQDIEAEFDRWASSLQSDAEMTTPFYAFQELVMKSALLRGDCFVDTPMIPGRGSGYALALRLIEADRVSNPNNELDSSKLAGGIELDRNGAPVYYHIRKSHPNDWDATDSLEWGRYPVFSNGFRRIMHIFRKDRGNRGISLLAPVLEPLHKIKKLDQAELDAAVTNAAFAVIAQTATGQGIGLPQRTFGDTTPLPTNKEPEKQTVLDSGLILNTIESDKIEFVDPKRPNINVNAFTNEIYKRIAAGIGIPVEELLLYYNKSYSASRAAMLRAWEWYKVMRYWITYMFCAPVYQLWFHEAVARGYIEAPGYEDLRLRHYWTQVTWIGPGKGSIDELKEAQASTEKIGNGTSNIQIESRESKGLDYFRDIHNQRVSEIQKRREDGIDVSTNMGDS
jgi:lambda family phage portal protein